MIIIFKFSILKVVLSINIPVTFQRKDLSHLHHLPPMHWSAQYAGRGFTQPHVLPWLPAASAWSNMADWHQTIIQSISKLREETPSIYMDGIYKENEKLPNYEIRYAHLLHNTYRFSTQQMLDASYNVMCYTIQATPTSESKCVHGTWLYTVTPTPNKTQVT
jgi:hypothetical protein